MRQLMQLSETENDPQIASTDLMNTQCKLCRSRQHAIADVWHYLCSGATAVSGHAMLQQETHVGVHRGEVHLCRAADDARHQILKQSRCAGQPQGRDAAQLQLRPPLQSAHTRAQHRRGDVASEPRDLDAPWRRCHAAKCPRMRAFELRSPAHHSLSYTCNSAH